MTTNQFKTLTLHLRKKSQELKKKPINKFNWIYIYYEIMTYSEIQFAVSDLSCAVLYKYNKYIDKKQDNVAVCKPWYGMEI